MRIEIRLSDDVAAAIKNKAEAMNHSRKSYIELLCIKDANRATSENTENTECWHPYNMVTHSTAGIHCAACGRYLNQ
jgi:hypothetical protein